MKLNLTGIVLAFVLASCSLPFNLGPSAKTIYRLTPDIAPRTKFQSSGKMLAVRETLSSGYINSHRIIFSRTEGQVGQYQYAMWEELPAKRLTDLSILGIQQLGLFTSVSRTTSGSISDYQLNIDLLDFTHQISSSIVHVVLQAELIDLRSRTILSQRTFVFDEKVLQGDAQGAVEGFNRAVRRAVMELGEWLGEVLGGQQVKSSDTNVTNVSATE